MRLLTAVFCILALSGCLTLVSHNAYFKPEPRHSGKKMAKALALEIGIGALVFGGALLASQDSFDGGEVPILALEGAGLAVLADLQVAVIVMIVGLIRGDPDPQPAYD